ncbi:MAG: zinc ribbon domain-containing protein [Candidatus Bathyarchaeota archaeon]|nr:zinc ribbon domain-containing protein [Candidatus Bathyarchaeota archaeon]
MSEEAKLAYLQEKINDVKRNERTGALGIVMGGVFVGVGIVFNALGGGVNFLAAISLIAVGIFLCTFGIYAAEHYAGQYKNLIIELEKLATSVPKCPKCGKELPKGTFEFCPFCGASLKR